MASGENVEAAIKGLYQIREKGRNGKVIPVDLLVKLNTLCRIQGYAGQI